MDKTGEVMEKSLMEITKILESDPGITDRVADQTDPEPVAHIRYDNGVRHIHPLDVHLKNTARMAAEFAKPFGSEDWAALAGLWHDLGKYQPAFQRYIRDKADEDAHIEDAPGRVDHSIVGALHALREFPEALATLYAYLIAGHHAGLADYESGEPKTTQLKGRLARWPLLDAALSAEPPKPLLQVNSPAPPAWLRNPNADPSLWLRMLFSCLTDADFLDTESFMDHWKAEQRGCWPDLSSLLQVFDVHMAGFSGDGAVNRVRTEVLGQCRESAQEEPGIYSLTVPTGGGKTLSSLAFALEHAKHYGKRRVIYAIPYTSIIEQTAEVFRGIFHESFGDVVVEHHSNLDPKRETAQSRLASENWDAPLVVTTNVQLFESLFAARTSRVRKLHNLVNSVVVLDEAQMLSVPFLAPILRVIQQLSDYYGVTFLLTTATQPALQERDTGEGRFPGLRGVREIVPDPKGLADRLKRVDINKVPLDRPLEWSELAHRLEEYPQVLCILNRRDDAYELARLMPRDTLHLSARMCGRHRSILIRWIRRRLRRGLSVRVVSTQLVEAGVDLDFPVVYRALAGLDAVAQAAGRCNREGRLKDGLGEVVVFRPPSEAPPGLLRQGADIGRRLLEQEGFEPLAPAGFERYFSELYWRQGREALDKHGINKLLARNPGQHYRFATAAKRFRLIDSPYETVVVKSGRKGRKLVEQLINNGPQPWLLRQLQRYTVALPSRQVQQELAKGTLLKLPEYDYYIQQGDLGYDSRFGFIGTDIAAQADDLVI